MQTTLVFQKSYDFYKQLYRNLRRIPKRDRYTWGERCETVALEMLALASRASYQSKGEKRASVHKLSFQIDFLKILLRLGHELRILDNKSYLARAGELVEIGKMVGGWMKTFR